MRVFLEVDIVKSDAQWGVVKVKRFKDTEISSFGSWVDGKYKKRRKKKRKMISSGLNFTNSLMQHPREFGY